MKSPQLQIEPIEWHQRLRTMYTQVIGDRVLMNMNLAEGWKTEWKLFLN